MKVIKITVASIAKPAGVTGGAWLFQIQQGGGNVVPTIFSAEPQTEWPTSLPAGEYALQGRRLDSNNNPLGPLIEGTYVWDGVGGEMVDVAGSIGVIDV